MPTDDHGLVYPNTTGVAPNGPQQIRDANASVNDQYGKSVATVGDLAALTTFPGKTVWVSSIKALAVFDGSAWRSSITKSGQVTISPVADTPTYVEVTFDTAFPVPPNLTATAYSSSSAVKTVAVSDVTETGCRVYLTRSNTTTTYVFWAAHGSLA